MALPVTEFKVGGREYKTTLLTARAGLVMMPKIIALFGREVTTLFLASGDEKAGSLLKNPEVQAAMLDTVGKNAADNDGLLVLHELMRHTTYKATLTHGTTTPVEVDASVYDNFDELFAGDYLVLFTVAMEVARASFVKPSSVK
jgi:hypothetical protein